MGTLTFCWGKQKWSNLFGKISALLLVKLNMNMPYGPAIPL